MSDIQWTIKSRYFTPRQITYSPEKGEVTILCMDVLYVSYSTEKHPITNAVLLQSVDPDGGPYLSKGTRLYPPENHPPLCIVSLLEESYDHANKCLIVKATIESIQDPSVS